MTKRYVCHIKDETDVHELGDNPVNERDDCAAWYTEQRFWLPRSHYRLCPAPKVWKDVSAELGVEPDGSAVQHKSHWVFLLPAGYMAKIIDGGLHIMRREAS